MFGMTVQVGILHWMFTSLFGYGVVMATLDKYQRQVKRDEDVKNKTKEFYKKQGDIEL